MSAASEVRASGLTTDQEVVRELAKEADQTPAPELPEERNRSFRFPGFSRMRTDWFGEDGMVMERVHYTVDDLINRSFYDLLAVRNELYDLIRTPEMDDNGEPRRDRFGWLIWARDQNGNFIEDWSRLSGSQTQRERFLFLITTRIFDWEETRDQMWAEAMMSKTQWEEAFSTGWQETEGARPTVDDKTANARLHSQEERYFAIFRTYLSRRADSLVDGMNRLAQRIKDVHTA